jgi:glycosyltransferase involved in cell wall biosynthesis
VLWNKNRNVDVCNPEAIKHLAKAHPEIEFYTTYAPENSPPNVMAMGITPHDQMKRIIGDAGVYLSTTKETFGIGVLEALSAGIPVLGFAHGGNLLTVQHMVNGYLARPWNYADLTYGLEYCLKHRKVLSDNARETARKWTWQSAMEIVAWTYQIAIDRWKDRRRPHTIDPSLYTRSENGEQPVHGDS